jgi:hypothetical protein
MPLPNGLTAPEFNVTGGFQINGNFGISGQVLASTGFGSQWITVSTQIINWTGAWAANTVYAKNEGFVESSTAYIVTNPYTSGSSFGSLDLANTVQISTVNGQDITPLSDTSQIFDKGGEIYNVKAYGATGNGVTDDTVAINAAITALTSSGGGILFFPHGVYYSATCGFSFSVPVIVEGTGKRQIFGGGVQIESELLCGSSTAYLLTFTGEYSTVEHMALFNSDGTTPTGGAAVYANGTDPDQIVNLYDVSIDNFYDGVDSFTTGPSNWRDVLVSNAVKYGYHIKNQVNADHGAWNMSFNDLISGPQTSTTSSAIFQESAGGGRISNNNISSAAGTSYWLHAYLGAPVGSIEMVITDNDIDYIGGTILDFTSLLEQAIVTNNILHEELGNAVPIIGNGFVDVVIGNNDLSSGCTPTCPAYLIQDVSGPDEFATFLPNINGAYTTAQVKLATPTSTVTNIADIGDQTVLAPTNLGFIVPATIQFPNGAKSAPLNFFAPDPSHGWYYRAGGYWSFTNGSIDVLDIGDGGSGRENLGIGEAGCIAFGSGDLSTTAADTFICRPSAQTLNFETPLGVLETLNTGGVTTGAAHGLYRCSGGTNDGQIVVNGSTAATACTTASGSLVALNLTTP